MTTGLAGAAYRLLAATLTTYQDESRDIGAPASVTLPSADQPAAGSQETVSAD